MRKNRDFLVISRSFLCFLGAKNAVVDRNNPKYVFVTVAIEAGSVLVHDLGNVKFWHFFHRFSQKKSDFRSNKAPMKRSYCESPGRWNAYKTVSLHRRDSELSFGMQNFSVRLRPAPQWVLENEEKSAFFCHFTDFSNAFLGPKTQKLTEIIRTMCLSRLPLRLEVFWSMIWKM